MPNFEILNDTQSVKSAQLQLLRDSLARAPYEGYPAQLDRLVTSVAALGRTATGNLVVPDGPWTVNAHPNRPGPIEIAPPVHEHAEFLAGGLELDSLGRPLHPWFREMIEDPAIGVVTGKGFYWEWGPNRTADPIILRGNEVLMVLRPNGQWALPGGFIDKGEQAINAAARESHEEAAISVPNIGSGIEIYQGAVIDPRVTANAWSETTAFVFRYDDAPEPIADTTEVLAARFFHRDEVLNGNILFGSHSLLFKRAVALGH